MRRIFELIAVVFIVILTWVSWVQNQTIGGQAATIRQLMAPMPELHLPPAPPVGIETPKRQQLDTPAPKEQNFV